LNSRGSFSSVIHEDKYQKDNAKKENERLEGEDVEE